LESKFKLVDTCGVHNLHGMPGLLGGFSALLVVPGIAGAQLTGIGITLCIAIVGGLVAGAIIKITGTTREPYEDSVEFTHMAGPESEQQLDQLQAKVDQLTGKASAPAPTPGSVIATSENRELYAQLESRIMELEAQIRASQTDSNKGEAGT